MEAVCVVDSFTAGLVVRQIQLGVCMGCEFLTVSLSQLIQRGIIMLVKVIAQAVGGVSQSKLLFSMAPRILPARKAIRAP